MICVITFARSASPSAAVEIVTTAKMFDVFDANIDHMLALIKNGLQIPDTIKEKIGWLADLCKV